MTLEYLVFGNVRHSLTMGQSQDRLKDKGTVLFTGRDCVNEHGNSSRVAERVILI